MTFQLTDVRIWSDGDYVCQTSQNRVGEYNWRVSAPGLGILARSGWAKTRHKAKLAINKALTAMRAERAQP